MKVVRLTNQELLDVMGVVDTPCEGVAAADVVDADLRGVSALVHAALSKQESQG